MVMPPSVSNQRNWVRRVYRAGRDDLRARGILPWAAFGQGVLPTNWWDDERFGWAVDEWRREAITWPADSTSTTYERVMARTSSAKQAALREIDETPWQPDAGSLAADEQEPGFNFSAAIDAERKSGQA
jgi:hypothetical protein